MDQNFFVPEELERLKSLYTQRNKAYGSNYNEFGHVMSLLVKDLELSGPDDFNRLGVLTQMLGKFMRYFAQFRAISEGKVGTEEFNAAEDCLRDLALYSVILMELDNEVGKRVPL